MLRMVRDYFPDSERVQTCVKQLPVASNFLVVYCTVDKHHYFDLSALLRGGHSAANERKAIEFGFGKLQM